MTGTLIFALALVTLMLVVGLGAWNYTSTRRNQKRGPNVKGLGGRNDPLA